MAILACYISLFEKKSRENRNILLFLCFGLNIYTLL